MQVESFSPEAQAIIKGFAKARRAGVSTVETLVREVLSTIPDPAPVVVSGEMKARRERQASEKSQQFRDAVMREYDSLKGNKYTFAEVARKFGIDAANATNNISWMKNHGKINFLEVGKAEKAPGTRGPAPTVIEFI